jgi:hypothetical protein
MSRGQGRLYRRKGTTNWWLDYSIRGVRHFQSSGTAKHKEAADLLRERIGQRKAGTLMGNPEAVTFAQLRELVERQYVLDGNRSLPRVQMALEHLEQFFGAERGRSTLRPRRSTPTCSSAWRRSAQRAARRATMSWRRYAGGSGSR